MPLFSILSVLVFYQLMSGWHVIYTREQGPNWIDAAMTACAATITFLLAFIIYSQPIDAKVVIYSSIGAIFFLLFYDTLRWFFPAKWHAHLWRYEHSFKLISSLFAMLSALVGNVVRVGQPWSQIVPSVLGLIVIAVFFVRMYKQNLSQEK